MRFLLFVAALSALAQGTFAPARAAYTTDGGSLMEIQLETGDITEIGPFGLAGSRIGDLALSPGGVLYGLDWLGGRLVTIDIETGQAEVVGPLGLAFRGGDMAFDSCGELWSLGEVVAVGIGLVQINPESGSANLIATGYESIHGLAAYEGRLITVSSGSANNPAAFEIDRHSGELAPLTSLQPVVFSFWPDLDFDQDGVLRGVTEFPSVPPPSPFGLVTIDLDSGIIDYDWNHLLSRKSALAIESPSGNCEGVSIVEIPTLTPPGLLFAAFFVAIGGLRKLVRKRNSI